MTLKWFLDIVDLIEIRTLLNQLLFIFAPNFNQNYFKLFYYSVDLTFLTTVLPCITCSWLDLKYLAYYLIRELLIYILLITLQWKDVRINYNWCDKMVWRIVIWHNSCIVNRIQFDDHKMRMFIIILFFLEKKFILLGH